MRAVSSAVKAKAQAHGLEVPYIYIEPGRSIVGEAGLTLYKVGSVKEIPGLRTYVAVDGGMTDNPLCALSFQLQRPAGQQGGQTGRSAE